MRRLALALLAFAATIVPAFAYDTPDALLKSLYAPYAQGDSFDWSKWDEAQFRSKALNALFDKDAKEADGEVGRLDFDPYIDGQDYQITELQIGEPYLVGGKAVVRVNFENMGTPEELGYLLVKEGGGWKIDDVWNGSAEYSYDLLDILEAPMP